MLERRPVLLETAVSSLLIGVTEFFREPVVFDHLRAWLAARGPGRRALRIWSAGCSSGAELYSMGILLAEAGLLGQSFLLGSDCRGDALEAARRALYQPMALRQTPPALRAKYFEPVAGAYRPVAALRQQARWKQGDLLTGVEPGPWDIILWRNAAIYLRQPAAEAIWRRLAGQLAPQGCIVAGKAERPPAGIGLTLAQRSIYRRLATSSPLAATIATPRPIRVTVRSDNTARLEESS